MELDKNISNAIKILSALGLPKAQKNERSALCLLALGDLRPRTNWREAKTPLMGITPIMDWSKEHYGKIYAPNTRETFRRQTMHQFVAAGIAIYNPDRPDRPVNSPKAVYQLAPEVADLVRQWQQPSWNEALEKHLSEQQTLADKYAMPRKQAMVPVQIAPGKSVAMSPGAHTELIRDIIEEFAPRFAPGSILVYAGDTGEKLGYFDEERLASLGVTVDKKGKMPDVVLHFLEKDWLLLVEAVTSHGPVDGKRHQELTALFQGCSAGLVYVTAFPSRSTMARYLTEIAWETEVWAADAPSHLIHFNGERFLGPY